MPDEVSKNSSAFYIGAGLISFDIGEGLGAGEFTSLVR